MIIEKSFGIIRTNPALTTNVKIVVTSDYKLYLESFQINKALSDDRYKHFEVKNTDYYFESLYYFYQNGMPLSQTFETPGREDEDEMFDDFKNQYNDTYLAGAAASEDTWYTEEYEYLAPLYVEGARPSNFIILRVDGPGLKSSTTETFRTDIVDQWKFINIFDLSPSSDLGRWLKQNIDDDTDYPKTPLLIKHDVNAYSEISGIDIETGGWITKTLDLIDNQTVNTPTFKTEETITNSFQNNNIAYPHILNFKFLFDDTPASPEALRKYSINRYLGFYVDSLDLVKTITPHQPYDLNKVPDNLIETLSAIECDNIPYLQDNIFVRDVEGRSYSFDPIKNGWIDGKTFWIEFNSKFYRLEKVVNTTTTIIGQYLYRVVADITIQRELDPEIQNLINTGATISPDVLRQQRKVIINDLSTMKNRVEITSKIVFPNFQANNVIKNFNPNFITYKRNFVSVYENGLNTYLFTLSLDNSDNNNLFSVDNFNSADLYLVAAAGNYYVLKQYPSNTPNVGGSYYLQADWAVNANQKNVTTWINNGNLTKQAEFYQETSVENFTSLEPVQFQIYRVKFSDIKDFDFDRVETKYSNFEYEIQDNFTETMEPKLYAKEHRKITVDVKKFPKQYAQKLPILDLNNDLYEPSLFQSDFNGNTLYTKDTDYQTLQLTLPREYYREEYYTYLVNGDVNKQIDFSENSDPLVFSETALFGTDGYTLDEIKQLPIIDIWPDTDQWTSIVGKKQVLTASGKTLPELKAKTDPNLIYDPNYIPVTSEYIASDELFEVRGLNLSPIWSKTPTIPKYGLKNSNNTGEYPYRLNYDLDIGGLENRSSNINSGLQYPLRSARDLDYFYRFGLVNKNKYKNYYLHLKDAYFDIDKYFSTSYDYFEAIMKSDQLTVNGITLTSKYSVFSEGNEYANPETVFKGMRYNIGDVEKISAETFLNTTTNTNQTYIEDIITTPSTKYNGYRFAITMGRKLSIFNNNPGRNNGNFGIDVYLNDIWKNVLINVYFETDDTLQIDDPDVTTSRLINAETCIIDKLYKDSDNERTDLNGLIWDKMEFKINGQNIGIRPRDLKMIDFMTILNNLNYRPDLSTEGETRNPVNFIHIYSDGSSKIMTNENTDFHIRTEMPSELLMRERGYAKTPLNIPLDINNSIENTIVLDDDPNNPLNDPDKTFEGVPVGAIADLNVYNGYPIAFDINDDNSDTRFYYELEEGRDPIIHRYDGSYIPIFRNVDLFRPLNYVGINHTNPIPGGNYKFYDPKHTGVLSTTNVQTFGFISELIFSKVNRSGNILKLNDPDAKYHSVFPMVDECGYSYIPKYLFQSNWDPQFYLESRKLVIPKNEYPTQAGYTINFSAEKDRVRVPDMAKFNYNIDGFPDANNTYFDELVLYSSWQTGGDLGPVNIVYDQDASNGLARKGTDTNRGGPHFIYGPYKDFPPGKYTVTFRIKIVFNRAYYTDNSQPVFVLDATGAYGSDVFAYDTITGGEIPVDGQYNDYTLTFQRNTIINRGEFRIRPTFPAGQGHIIFVDYISCQREEMPLPPYIITPTSNTVIVDTNKLLIPGKYYRVKITGTGLSYNAPCEVYSGNPAPHLIASSTIDTVTGGGTICNSLLYIPMSYYPALALGEVVKYYLNGFVSQFSIEEATPYADLKFTSFSTSGGGFCIEMKKDTDEYFSRIEMTNVTSVNDVVNRLKSVFLGILPPNTTGKKLGQLGGSIFDATVVEADITKAAIKIHQRSQNTPVSFNNFKIQPKKTHSDQADYDFLYRDHQSGESNNTRPQVTFRCYYTKPIDLTLNFTNFAAVNVTADTMYTTNNQNIDQATIINQINSDLSGLPYTASFVGNAIVTNPDLSTTQVGYDIAIISDNDGSYYNFTMTPNTVSCYVKKVLNMGNPTTVVQYGVVQRYRSNFFGPLRYSYFKPVRNGIFRSVIIQPKTITLFSQIINIPAVGIISSAQAAILAKQQSDALAAQKAAENAKNFATQTNTTPVKELSVISISTLQDTTITTEIVSGKHLNLTKSKVGYTTSFTVEFWMYVGGWTSNYQTIMYKGFDGIDPWTESTLYISPNFSWVIGRDNNTNRLAFRTCHIKPEIVKSLVNFAIGANFYAGQTLLYNNMFFYVKANCFTVASFGSIIPKLTYRGYQEVLDIHTLTLDKELNDNDWHHVAFTFNGDINQKTIYIDGLPQARYKSDSPLLTNVRTSMSGAVDTDDASKLLDVWDLLIGTDSIVNNGRRNFMGAIDELRIWNYERSSDDIFNNYRLSLNKTSYLNPEKSLTFYLRFDEGKGVNQFADLMSFDKSINRGWLIDDIDRYQITSKQTIDNGKALEVTNNVSVRQFVSSWDTPEGTPDVPSNRAILVADTNIEWILSGADIQGYSDERYVGKLPPASTTIKNIELPKVIIPKSKFVLAEPPQPTPTPMVVIRPHFVLVNTIISKHFVWSVQKPVIVQQTISFQPAVEDNPFRIFGLLGASKPLVSWYKQRQQEVLLINTKTIAGIRLVASSIYSPFKYY